MAKDLQSNKSDDTEEKVQQMDEGVPTNDTNTNILPSSTLVDSYSRQWGLAKKMNQTQPGLDLQYQVQPMRLRGQGLGGERGHGK